MRFSALAAIGGTLIGLVGSSAALAQEINGCIKQNGTLTVVAGSGSCANNETPIVWNGAGTKGDKGDPGEPGPEGPPGPAFRLLDGQSRSLGMISGTGDGLGRSYWVFHEALALLVQVTSVAADGPFANVASVTDDAVYPLPNCQGQPHFDFNSDSGRFATAGIISRAGPASELGTFFIVPSDAAVTEDFAYQSRLPSAGPCGNGTGSLSFAIAGEPFDAALLGWQIPIPLPFTVDLITD